MVKLAFYANFIIENILKIEQMTLLLSYSSGAFCGEIHSLMTFTNLDKKLNVMPS